MFYDLAHLLPTIPSAEEEFLLVLLLMAKVAKAHGFAIIPKPATKTSAPAGVVKLEVFKFHFPLALDTLAVLLFILLPAKFGVVFPG